MRGTTSTVGTDVERWIPPGNRADGDHWFEIGEQAKGWDEMLVALPVQCAGCGKALRVRDELRGKRVKCPSCGHVLSVTRSRPADASAEGEADLTRGVGTNAQWLVLDYTQIADAGLEHLEGFTDLESLGLRRTHITDAGLEHLKGLTNLRELYLSSTITETGLNALRKTLSRTRIVH